MSIRPGPPQLFTVSHEDTRLVQQHFPIPFDPDWMMDVLGVRPINAENVTLQPCRPGSLELHLTQRYLSPAGRSFQRVRVVDRRVGQVVEHRLIDEAGTLVASTELSDHRSVGPAVLPHHLRLRLPQTKTSLAIQIDQIDHRSSIDPGLWTVPRKKGIHVVDLGADIKRKYAENGALPLIRTEPMHGPKSDSTSRGQPASLPRRPFASIITPRRSEPVTPPRGIAWSPAETSRDEQVPPWWQSADASYAAHANENASVASINPQEHPRRIATARDYESSFNEATQREPSESTIDLTGRTSDDPPWDEEPPPERRWFDFGLPGRGP